MTNDKKMPPAKEGKTYPASYFTAVNKNFQIRDGQFDYLGWKFERMGRNQIKVLSIPATTELGLAK